MVEKPPQPGTQIIQPRITSGSTDQPIARALALAILDYQFYRTSNVVRSGMIGYKALYVDYVEGSGLSEYEFEMTMHGPVFGITAQKIRPTLIQSLRTCCYERIIKHWKAYKFGQGLL